MTRAIELTPTPIDDPMFVELVSAFVSHYAVLYKCETIRVIHVGNWFGDRWLGFAGKILGAAGVRNRTVNGPQLPSPPFRPSRIKTVLKFDLQSDGLYTPSDMPIGHVHTEKRGDDFWHLYRPGLFVWYSGNTRSNTTGSLMIYDVTRDGSTGWYVLFEHKTGWSVTRSTNVSREECARILDHFRADFTTEPSDAPESSS